MPESYLRLLGDTEAWVLPTYIILRLEADLTMNYADARGYQHGLGLNSQGQH